MAKAIIVIGATQVIADEAAISYTVSVIKTGGQSFSYAGDYQVNTGTTLNANLLAWRNKILGEIAEKGIIVSASDLIIFGGPV